MNRLAKGNLKHAMNAASAASDIVQTVADIVPQNDAEDGEEGDGAGGLQQVAETLGDAKDALEAGEELADSVSNMKGLFCCCGKKTVRQNLSCLKHNYITHSSRSLNTFCQHYRRGSV